jgi:hypothetical protein
MNFKVKILLNFSIHITIINCYKIDETEFFFTRALPSLFKIFTQINMT